MRQVIIVASALLFAMTTVMTTEASDDIFLIRTTPKSPDAMVLAIKDYTEKNKWQYLGEIKVKKGEVRLVKICIPEVGRLIWPVGLQLSALLPCGNVGVYLKDGATEISVLHPRYMQLLYPHPATERASIVAQPLLTDMLDAVTR